MESKRDKLLYSHIGTQVRQAREQRGFNQSELAAMSGISRVSVVNIEKGRQRLPIHVLWSLAEHLGVEPATLLPRHQDLVNESSHPLLDNVTLAEIEKVTKDDPAARRQVSEFIGTIVSRGKAKKHGKVKS